MTVRIDKKSPVPLHRQVKDYLLDFIRRHRGRTTPVPPEIEISRRFRISRATVRVAFHALVNEGLIERIPGKGTFLRETKRHLVFPNWLSHEPLTRDAFRAILSRFLQGHPGVEIEDLGIPYADLEHRLMTMAASGQAPDLAALVYSWVPLLAYQGAILPLDDRYTPAMRRGVHPASLQAVTYRDQLFAVNWISAPNILYYNRKILAEHLGTASPRIERYDDLLDLFIRLHERSKGKIVPMSIPVADDEILFLYSLCNFLYAYEGGLITGEGEIIFNSGENIKAFTWLKRFIKAGHIDTAGGIGANRARFARNQIAFLIEGPWLRNMIPTLNADYRENLDAIGFSVLPKGPKGFSASVLWNHVLSIFRQCRDKDLAFELIRYITMTPEIGESYYRATGMPPAFDGGAGDTPAYDDPFGRVLQRQMETAIPIPVGHPRPMAFHFAVMLCAKASREIFWGGADVALTLNHYAALMKEFCHK